MFATEYPHTLQTRGIYRTKTWYRDMRRNEGNVKWYQSPRGETPSHPLVDDPPQQRAPLEVMHIPDLTDEELFTGIDEHYQSSYGNAIVRMSIFDSWYRTKSLPFFCGEFRWTGFDYIGECYGWPAKSWNFGIIDLCGFPKDAYYFLQSQWTNTPMVHLLPHWTWPGLEGKQIPVFVYSNCDTVELFLNGKSLGKQSMDKKRMYCRWDVTYEPGSLKSVAYNGDKEIASKEQTTASEAAGLHVTIEDEPTEIESTGLIHAVIEVTDANGIMVPYANHEITVNVEGPAKLLGLENGDPIDSTNYKLNQRKAFNGMMLAIIKATGDSKDISISASANGVTSATGRIQHA
jgi:beta-galactosidase